MPRPPAAVAPTRRPAIRRAALLALLATAGALPAQDAFAPFVGEQARMPTADELPALLDELTALLGDPDPRRRDGLAYSLLAKWIVRDGVVPEAQLRRLLRAWRPALARAEPADEPADGAAPAVLRRSFSALSLGLLVKRDNQSPWLDEEEFDALLADALAYLRAEQDLRGYDDRLGWIHAVAHTADLVKFAGRSRHLKSQQQAAILAAIADRLASAAVTFTAGEDLRLSQAALSLCARDDFDGDAFAAFARGLATRTVDGGEGRRIAFAQNRRHVLVTLFALVSLDDRERPGFAAARAALKAALGGG